MLERCRDLNVASHAKTGGEGRYLQWGHRNKNLPGVETPLSYAGMVCSCYFCLLIGEIPLTSCPIKKGQEVKGKLHSSAAGQIVTLHVLTLPQSILNWLTLGFNIRERPHR